MVSLEPVHAVAWGMRQPLIDARARFREVGDTLPNSSPVG